MGIELCFAKMGNVPVRIAHCHNSRCEHINMHRLLYPLFKTCYTQAVACPSLAGDWIFGSGNYTILPNAVDLNGFKYDCKIRKCYRKKLKIDDRTLLIGHVGSFNEQKITNF